MASNCTSPSDHCAGDNHNSLSSRIIMAAVISCFILFAFAIWFCICREYLQRISNQQGAASGGGTNRKTLASLPMFVYSAEDESREDKAECPVCLMEFKEGEEGCLLPLCRHKFHVECIEMWLMTHSTCPLCRAAVVKEVEALPELDV